MYKIYTDKDEIFEAKLDITGASMKDSTCRLIIERQDYDVLLPGTLDSQGNCSIDIGKVRKMFSEGDHGEMKLEVIVDDTRFTPWESTYTVETSKKVTAEVKSPIEEPVEKKPRVTVSIKADDNATVKKIVAEMKSRGLTPSEIRKNPDMLKTIMTENIRPGNDIKFIFDRVSKIIKKANESRLNQ